MQATTGSKEIKEDIDGLQKSRLDATRELQQVKTELAELRQIKVLEQLYYNNRPPGGRALVYRRASTQRRCNRAMAATLR